MRDSRRISELRRFLNWKFVCAIGSGLVPALVFTVIRPTELAAKAPTSPGQIDSIRSLAVSPSEIKLTGSNRRQQLLVTAETMDGRLIDVTGESQIESASPKCAKSEGAILVGVSDGTTELTIRIGKQSKRVPVSVTGFQVDPAVHFANDIVPLFTKLGCNSGGCHGKASGQNGFKLSLFGFNPNGDFESLVHEARGRRVSAASPEQSLLVQKATARTAHGGGKRAVPGSPDEELLVRWVRQGTPRGESTAPRLVSLRVEPVERVLATKAEQQILATAVYSDGSSRDVTSAALYTSNAAGIADVVQPGRVQAGTVPGEAAITVNFMGQVAAVQIQIPRTSFVVPSGGTGESLGSPLPKGGTTNGAIDSLVWAKLKKMGIRPSGPVDDATFLRRAYLDTIGTLPTADEVREFLADKTPDKRRRLVDRLLDREEFADYWALKWADILLVDQKKLGDRGAYEFHRWLRDNFANNKPYDEWVRELITATGNSGKVGPVNFYRALRAPEDLARSVSQAFLGIRLDCAQCHHHPYDRWGQDDFYGMAGFFNGLTYKPLAGDAAREMVYHAGYRETKLPLSGEPVSVKPPGGDVSASVQTGDPRAALAQWMTSPDNPWFSRLIANRLWKHFLGRGLVEPEDDLRVTNPPTNPALLDHLARAIVAARFDLKDAIRQIANSQAYQLSSVANETNADDEQNFSHYVVKRLPAEVLMDAVSQVTGVPEEFRGLPRGTRALQLWDNRFPSYFLEIFGRPERNTPCECGRSNEPTMAQALHLMNAPEIDAKIRHPKGRLAQLLSKNMSREQLVETLCLTTLGRLPNEKEQSTATRLFSGSPPREAAEDFLWALLNSYDFLFVK